MSAMSHAFKTEIENKSIGKPSFLSRHIDALCPPTQEEDEWLDQELERARLQRGTFYKKLANSRSASARELDDLSASKQRSASRGSTERELILPPGGPPPPPPPAIPEPHSSWRFYTSFDNGEWKRHCVPVYKAEEDILMKSPSDSANKENSPAFESHLRKYRQARASLFDRPPSRRHTGISPREETTTVRIVSGGNDAINRSSTGPVRLPFGRSAHEGNVRTVEHHFGDKTGPVSFPSAYKQEVTTSETITTIQEPDPKIQVKEKPRTPVALNDPSRPKHHHLGFKEKVIIPTKYKTDAEKAAEAAAAAAVPKTNGFQTMDSFHKKETGMDKSCKIDPDADKPSFLGSTFEKFSYSGAPLVKPSSVDMLPDQPMFGNSFSKNVTVKVENVQKPSFDSAPVKPFSPFQHSSSEHVKPVFQNSNFEISSSFGPPFGSSTPIKNKVQTSTTIERSSLPFDNVQSVHSIPVSYRHAVESFKVPEVPPIEVTGENISLGNQFSAFSAPTKNRQISTENEPRASSTATSTDTKKEGVIFIPVIRVLSPSKDPHATQTSVNVQSHHDSSDRLRDVPILELEEDKSVQQRTIEEISRNTPVHDKVILPSSSSSTNQVTRDSGGTSSSFQEKIIIPSKAKTQIIRESSETASVPSFQEKILIPSTVKQFDKDDPVAVSNESSSHEKIIIPSVAKSNSRFVSTDPVHEMEIKTNVISHFDGTPGSSTPNSDARERVQRKVFEDMPAKIEKPVFSNERHYKSQIEVVPQRIPISVDLSSVVRENTRSTPDQVHTISINARSESNNALPESHKSPITASEVFGHSSNISPKLQFWSPSSSPAKDQATDGNLSNVSAKNSTTVDKEYSFDTDDWVIEKAVRM